MPRFSDEDLTAYLDGEADADLTAEIAAALAEDRALAARIDAQMIDRDRIAAAFDTVLASAPAPPGDLDAPHQPAGRGWAGRAQMAVAAVLGIVVGATALLLNPFGRHPDWQSAAATYHKLYVTDTLQYVTPSTAELSVELQRVSDSLGREIRLEDVSAVEALSPRRAQVLSFSERPLVQIAFLTDDGLPIALCIYRDDRAVDAPLDLSSIQGMSAATWSRTGYAFMLIGGADDARIRAAALGLIEKL